MIELYSNNDLQSLSSQLKKRYTLLGVILAVILGLVALGVGEVAAGIAGLAAVGVYYLLLWLLRDRFRNEYVFTIAPCYSESPCHSERSEESKQQ